mmetsp:Transcript_1635/g.3646  ORF Transcript_1635/g.3646 Transcript_1635/m.3646 type:complete len:232 (+) Transcript_1635:761-1456(+)
MALCRSLVHPQGPPVVQHKLQVRSIRPLKKHKLLAKRLLVRRGADHPGAILGAPIQHHLDLVSTVVLQVPGPIDPDKNGPQGGDIGRWCLSLLLSLLSFLCLLRLLTLPFSLLRWRGRRLRSPGGCLGIGFVLPVEFSCGLLDPGCAIVHSILELSLAVVQPLQLAVNPLRCLEVLRGVFVLGFVRVVLKSQLSVLPSQIRLRRKGLGNIFGRRPGRQAVHVQHPHDWQAV